jgi:hypothetical protein
MKSLRNGFSFPVRVQARTSSSTSIAAPSGSPQQRWSSASRNGGLELFGIDRIDRHEILDTREEYARTLTTSPNDWTALEQRCEVAE